MSNFKQKSIQENMQFLFLCGKRDSKLLLAPKRKKDLNEYVRLTCISLVFGYKTVFLKIAGIVEKNTDEFLTVLKSIEGNFLKLNEWVDSFIDNIAIPEAQALAKEFWQEQKEKLDVENFDAKLLFNTV